MRMRKYAIQFILVIKLRFVSGLKAPVTARVVRNCLDLTDLFLYFLGSSF